MTVRRFVATLLAAALVLAQGAASPARAQTAKDSPSAAEAAEALSAVISAACRANQEQFAKYLTAENAAAFKGLRDDQRASVLKRISLLDDPGKPLLSSDPQQHTVVRCVAAGGSVEFRFGDARVHESLAFIPVNVPSARDADFGLVKENGGWRLLSIGLLLFDISQLSHSWVSQDLQAREDAVVQTLKALADAVETYRRAWGKLPESLAQMGPAPPNEISPEQASLINENIAAGSLNGYSYRYRIVPAANEAEAKFELAASPEDYGKTGKRSFLLDAGGKIHGADKHGAVAAIEDPLIAGEKTE
jgi:hypothetical protein